VAPFAELVGEGIRVFEALLVVAAVPAQLPEKKVHGGGRWRLYTFVGTTAAAGDGAPRLHGGPDRSEVRTVPLAELSVGYSARLVRVDDDHVALLMEALERLPPIIVNEATMTVIDGVHRAEAFRRAGRTEIRAVLYSGDETGAQVIAVQANVRHGKPLSRQLGRVPAVAPGLGEVELVETPFAQVETVICAHVGRADRLGTGGTAQLTS
jgi:hypothetical protein